MGLKNFKDPETLKAIMDCIAALCKCANTTVC